MEKKTWVFRRAVRPVELPNKQQAVGAMSRGQNEHARRYHRYHLSYSWTARTAHGLGVSYEGSERLENRESRGLKKRYFYVEKSMKKRKNIKKANGKAGHG